MGHVLRGGSGLRGRRRNGGTKGEEEIGGVRDRREEDRVMTMTTTVAAVAPRALSPGLHIPQLITRLCHRRCVIIVLFLALVDRYLLLPGLRRVTAVAVVMVAGGVGAGVTVVPSMTLLVIVVGVGVGAGVGSVGAAIVGVLIMSFMIVISDS